ALQLTPDNQFSFKPLEGAQFPLAWFRLNNDGLGFGNKGIQMKMSLLRIGPQLEEQIQIIHPAWHVDARVEVRVRQMPVYEPPIRNRMMAFQQFAIFPEISMELPRPFNLRTKKGNLLC